MVDSWNTYNNEKFDLKYADTHNILVCLGLA